MILLFTLSSINYVDKIRNTKFKIQIHYIILLKNIGVMTGYWEKGRLIYF